MKIDLTNEEIVELKLALHSYLTKEEREEEEETEQPIVPGQNNPDESEQKAHIHLKESVEEHAQLSVQEWVGFNYDEYLGEIIKFTRNDEFEALKVVEQKDLEINKLNSVKINALKDTLIDGYENDKTLGVIALNIKENVNPGDAFRFDENGKKLLVMNEDARSMAIARSEITRTSSAGAREHYKLGGVEKYQWVASLGSRTCPICEGLNGQLFDIDSTIAPPAHVSCRCTIIPMKTG